eukprot:7778235-Heterocapsa_arctica.AAC.1
MLKATHIQSHKREKANKHHAIQKHIVEEKRFEDKGDTEDNNNAVILRSQEQDKPTMVDDRFGKSASEDNLGVQSHTR